MVIDNDNILVCSERHDGGPLSWAEGRQPWFKSTWLYSFQYLFSVMVNQFSSLCATFQVKLTTIHPFTVDTGLAKKPRSRLKIVLIKNNCIPNPRNSLSRFITYCFYAFYLHIFKSHYLYFTQQTVSCGVAPKIIRHIYTVDKDKMHPNFRNKRKKQWASPPCVLFAY